MQRLSLRQFKMNYHEQGKEDTFTGLPLSYMYYVEPVPMKRHVLSDFRPELSSTGLTGWLPTDFTGFGTGNIPDDLAVFLPRKCKDYEKNYGVLPEILVTTRTCGTACYWRIIWKGTMPYRSVYGNAKGYSIKWDLACKDLVARLAKPVLPSRRHLKKLLRVDERPHDPALVRGRSPFSATQQLDKNVGSKRTTTTRTLTFGPPQSRFFRGTQPKNRLSPHARGCPFQFRDLCRLYPFSTQIYSWENIPYPGQCKMAQSEGFERFLRVQSRPSSTYLSPTIFTRTQSGGTSLANHSSSGNSQSLFSVGRRTKGSFSISIFEMAAT